MSQLPPQGSAPHWVPPTVAQPLAPRPSAWPTVFGVIMIVVGSVAALQGCANAFSPVFFQLMETTIQAVDPDAPTGMEAMRKWAGWIIANGVVATVLGGMCLAAGIGLVKRRAWGARHAMWWAIAKLTYIIPSAVFQILFQMDNMEAMKAQMAAQRASGAPVPLGFMNSLMSIGLIVGTIVSVLWLLALPMTLLIWLRRDVIRREVAGWK